MTCPPHIDADDDAKGYTHRFAAEVQKSRIRGTHDVRELPVILFTGLDAPDAFDTAGQLGANAWLAKPYQLADLLAAVRGQIEAPTVLARTV